MFAAPRGDGVSTVYRPAAGQLRTTRSRDGARRTLTRCPLACTNVPPGGPGSSPDVTAFGVDFPQAQTVDHRMDPESKSTSIPLTSQHLVAVPPPGPGWEETYKKLDSLGRGGCAEVFKALDKRSGEIVALKVSNESDEELRRFSREVKTLRTLCHQNVIEILDAGDCWYAMPSQTET